MSYSFLDVGNGVGNFGRLLSWMVSIATLSMCVADTAFAQRILNHTRSISAYSETYEPFFDNITYTDSDEDSTTATGAFNASVQATTSFLNADYGAASASQVSNIASLTFNANGRAAAESSLYYGADSLAQGKSNFDLTFRLGRAGRLSLLGTMQGAGFTYYPGDEVLVDTVYASLTVTNTSTGAIVYSKRMGLGESIDLEDGTINLSRGTYKVSIVASCENSTYPADYLAVFDTFAEYDIVGTISHR